MREEQSPSPTIIYHKRRTNMDINSLLCTKNDCACGKVHSCDIENVIIKKNAISDLLKDEICGKYNKILLICDNNTYIAAGEKAEKILGDKIEYSLIFQTEGFLVPNEESVALVESKLTAKTQLILGVGSGVINDICKYVSFNKGLPYYIVATAPSMDGYASKGAAMLMQGMKITYNTHVPKCIIGDVDVLKNAPLEMIKSGYGDIIGKFSCLNDWKLSKTVNGEEICDYIYDLTYETALGMSKMGKAVISRTDDSIEYLMKALVIVGIAMAYMGNSRPASGSEHHLSHYFEVVGLLKDEPYFCHGTDVAYSMYAVQLLREKLLKLDAPEKKVFDREKWESDIRRIYTTSADGIIALQEKLGWIYEDKTDVYKAKWSEIKEVLSEVPASEEILKMLCDAELPIDDFYKMYSSEKLEDAYNYAKELKDRYTVLWLYSSVRI